MTPSVLRAAYEASVVEVTWPGGRAVLHPGEVGVLERLPAWLRGSQGTAIQVVTAWNPRSRRLRDDENDLRDVRLRELLRAGGIAFVDALGRSEDGAWREASVALLRTTMETALDVARRFDQHAIYVIDVDGVRVVDT